MDITPGFGWRDSDDTMLPADSLSVAVVKRAGTLKADAVGVVMSFGDRQVAIVLDADRARKVADSILVALQGIGEGMFHE